MIRKILAVLSVATLTACGGAQWATDYVGTVDPAVSNGWVLSSISVVVPDTLTVSEANSFAPRADIVWHGEPPGDRHAQVKKIMTEALTAGASGLNGTRPVIVGIVVDTFHGVTPKTRYSLENAGVHNISFTAQVFDAATGAPITEPDAIQADLIALSGGQALAAENAGQTQRVRIVAHVTQVIAGWLGTGPDVRGAFSRLGR